jgi:hypothetical protein
MLSVPEREDEHHDTAGRHGMHHDRFLDSQAGSHTTHVVVAVNSLPWGD